MSGPTFGIEFFRRRSAAHATARITAAGWLGCNHNYQQGEDECSQAAVSIRDCGVFEAMSADLPIAVAKEPPEAQ